MANQLIPVFSGTIANESALLCDARELHIFLGVNRDFSNWIRDRIADYGFVENKDYILLAKNGEQRKGRGGHNRKEYHLTLDTGKELAMVERNNKGRQLRRYFIECEKKLHGKYLPVIQPMAALPESGMVPYPTTLEFDIPEPMVIVKGSAVSQLNALFGTVEYLEKEMWPHLQALFPLLEQRYSGAFETSRILMRLLKDTRHSFEEARIKSC